MSQYILAWLLPTENRSFYVDHVCSVGKMSVSSVPDLHKIPLNALLPIGLAKQTLSLFYHAEVPTHLIKSFLPILLSFAELYSLSSRSLNSQS